ncbi:unnamed protein product [Durusdinium trenchii]|uniref:Uncharacterized protein n=1 Tax=Durusdinium trenchii TaxID=1381693 RepID=A0ABP0NGN1_9DINO
MAFERLRALESYLDECKSLSNFNEILEKQCAQVVREVNELSKLEMGEAAPLLAMVQQNKLWTKEMQDTICQALTDKVEQSLGRNVLSARSNLQDFVHCPLYLTEADWAVVLGDGNVAEKNQCLMERLYKLGLRNPTEDTYAMLTTLLLLKEPHRFNDFVQLRSSYLAVKNLVKSFLKNQGKSAQGATQNLPNRLPPTVSAYLQEEVKNDVYGPGGGPAPLPNGVSMLNLTQLMQTVPERSTRSTISTLVPKSQPHPAVESMMHAMNNMWFQSMQSMHSMSPFGFGQASQQGPHLSIAPARQQLALPAPGVTVPQAALAAPAVTAPQAKAAGVENQISQIEVVTPQPSMQAPAASSVKAPLAIENGPSVPETGAQEKTKEASALSVNERLEEALQTRDMEKKEKMDQQVEEKMDAQEKVSSQPKDQEAPLLKKPAAAKPKAKAKAPPIKTPVLKRLLSQLLEGERLPRGLVSYGSADDVVDPRRTLQELRAVQDDETEPSSECDEELELEFYGREEKRNQGHEQPSNQPSLAHAEVKEEVQRLLFVAMLKESISGSGKAQRAKGNGKDGRENFFDVWIPKGFKKKMDLTRASMTQGLVLGGNLTMYLLNLFIILRAVEAHVASVALRACVWSLDTSIASASDICIEYYESVRPENGFTIMGNGHVVRGKNPNSYTEEQIEHYKKVWVTMKLEGYFDEKAGDVENPSNPYGNPRQQPLQPRGSSASSSSTMAYVATGLGDATSQEVPLEPVDPNMPATQLYEDGTSGPVGPAREDMAPASGPETKAPETEEVPQVNPGIGPFVETQVVPQDGDGDQDFDIALVTCKKCNLPLKLEEAIIRGPRELWCRECNSIYTMLRRHQAWPPAAFAQLSDSDQQCFFARCKQQKDESARSQFSYSRIRDVLVSSLMSEQRKQKTLAVGGTYLPLSVYKQRGYIIDEAFTERNPCQWSHGLNCYTYLLAETSISEAEIHATVEQQVVTAERMVKKRKAVRASDKNEVEDDARSTKPMVLDLVSDDEDEGEKNGPSSGPAHPRPESEAQEVEEKQLTAKQLQAKLKREAAKVTKLAAAEERRKEAQRKKDAKALTKKVVAMSSKLSAPLAAAVHKANEVVAKAESAGVGDAPETQASKSQLQIVDDYKKKTASSLAYYSKNPTCELSALPFDNEKTCQQAMKDLAKAGSDLKAMVINPAAAAGKS